MLNPPAAALASAKTSPSSVENRINMGDYYDRRGESEKAIAEYEKAINENIQKLLQSLKEDGN